MNKRCERLIRERHAIEEKTSTTRHEQTSISKAARNLINEEKSLLANILLEIATKPFSMISLGLISREAKHAIA